MNEVGTVVGLVVGVVGLISLLVTYLHNRDSVKVDEFAAVTVELHRQLDDVKRDLAGVKRDLLQEIVDHSATRDMLRIALRHIRDLVAWGAGERLDPMPESPAELLDQL